MAKSLRSFLEDCCKDIPHEVIRITKSVDPAHYDASAIVKHLGARKTFPIVIFERPRDLNGRESAFPLFRGNMLDPPLEDEIKPSGMIVDATRPLDRPFSPVSKCPDQTMRIIK